MFLHKGRIRILKIYMPVTTVCDRIVDQILYRRSSKGSNRSKKGCRQLYTDNCYHYPCAVLHQSMKGNTFIMRHNNQRLVISLVAFFQQFNNPMSISAVQTTCRFIYQHDCRSIHQSTSDSDALLLVTGKLIRKMVLSFLQAKHIR